MLAGRLIPRCGRNYSSTLAPIISFLPLPDTVPPAPRANDGEELEYANLSGTFYMA
jgi:hypothetical protein